MVEEIVEKASEVVEEVISLDTGSEGKVVYKSRALSGFLNAFIIRTSGFVEFSVVFDRFDGLVLLNDVHFSTGDEWVYLPLQVQSKTKKDEGLTFGTVNYLLNNDRLIITAKGQKNVKIDLVIR